MVAYGQYYVLKNNEIKRNFNALGILFLYLPSNIGTKDHLFFIQSKIEIFNISHQAISISHQAFKTDIYNNICEFLNL